MYAGNFLITDISKIN